MKDTAAATPFFIIFDKTDYRHSRTDVILTAEFIGREY